MEFTFEYESSRLLNVTILVQANSREDFCADVVHVEDVLTGKVVDFFSLGDYDLARLSKLCGTYAALHGLTAWHRACEDRANRDYDFARENYE